MFEKYLAHSRGRIVAVVDIGSGSAAAGIVEVFSHGPAIVHAHERVMVPIDERDRSAAIRAVATAAVSASQKALASHAAAHGRPPERLYGIVRTPWARSETLRSHMSYGSDVTMNEATLRDLAKRALSGKKAFEVQNLLRASIVSVDINGYPTTDPLHKSAHLASMTVLLSEIDPEIRAAIQTALHQAFPHLLPVLHPSVEALLAAHHNDAYGTGDRLVIDVGAESTTLLAVRDACVVGQSVVSEGVNALLNRVAPKAMPEETLDLIKMVSMDNCTTPACIKTGEALAVVASDLVRVYGEGMSACASSARLPNQLLLIARPEVLGWFSSFFSRIDFGQFTLTTQPFSVRALSPDDVSKNAQAGEHVSADVSFLLTAGLVNTEERRRGVGWYTLDSMVKEYFEDITPPHKPSGMQRPTPKPQKAAPPPPPEPEETDEYDDEVAQPVPIRADAGEPRGIRNIAPPRMGRPGRFTGSAESPSRTFLGSFRPSRPASGSSSRWWLWAIAGVGVLVVAGLFFIGSRPTTVTVTPRAHLIQLTDATPYVAYPAATAATGTLTYTTVTVDLDDSAVVNASGTATTQAAKASGSITVYNAYSGSPVRLIKDTRFATPDGLIFRTPAEVVVPAMKGSTPGSVTITVIADQEGAQYNIGPVDHFTVPGLAGNAAMYKGVYAKSTASMNGGATASTGPGVDPATMSATISQLKSELAGKVLDAVQAQAGSDAIVLPGLMHITYVDQPTTAEGTDKARVHERAHVVTPVFPANMLGQTVGSAVSADASNATVTLQPGSGFAAQYAGAEPALGADPVQFTLTGQANLVWNIDTNALAQALAGRDQGAFQTVISGFSGIQEAHAKIEPFWKNTFPTNPSDIKIAVTAPKADQ